MLSTLDHFPTVDFHPIMDLFTQALESIITPSSRAEFCKRTPSPMIQLGPMETLGPIKHPLPIFAEGSIKTGLTIPSPEAKAEGFRSSNEAKYKLSPTKKSLGCPTSIQNPSKFMQYSLPSEAILGKISFSIEVGRNSMRF